MKKNCLIDVDGLLQVLQAIKDGKPVEYRPLEEPDWRDFDPANCEIDTENCKYRVKPVEYGDFPGVVSIYPEDLDEDRIYLLRNKDNGSDKGFICVKSNQWECGKMMSLHFCWINERGCATLEVCDPDIWNYSHSEYSESFANSISPRLDVFSLDNFNIFLPSQKQVNMLESKLREIGYEFKNGKMQKLNGNKA